MTTTAIANRHLSFQISFNVRHMGGYRTRDGRTTRPEIIRAASLHRLTDEGVDTFVAHGITTVVDLRSEGECRLAPSPNMTVHGVRHIHAPVFKGDASPVGMGEGGFAGFATVYRGFLESGREAYRTLFEVVADTDGAVIFHCAAGKDRTGVAAALLLDFAGVEDVEILADYAQSAELLRDAFRWEQLSDEQRARMGKLTPEMRAKLLASEPEDIADTLEYVRGRWGSTRGYFEYLGLAPETLARLRARIAS